MTGKLGTVGIQYRTLTLIELWVEVGMMNQSVTVEMEEEYPKRKWQYEQRASGIKTER